MHMTHLLTAKQECKKLLAAHVEGEAVPADFLVVLQDGRLEGLGDELRQLVLLVQGQLEPAQTAAPLNHRLLEYPESNVAELEHVQACNCADTGN
jgi:hypothetical protein